VGRSKQTAQIEQVIMNLVVNARDAIPREADHFGNLKRRSDASYAEKHVSVKPGKYVMLLFRYRRWHEPANHRSFLSVLPQRKAVAVLVSDYPLYTVSLSKAAATSGSTANKEKAVHSRSIFHAWKTFRTNYPR
jgi:hypothetical protein